MKTLFRFSFPRLSFLRQLVLTFTIGILLLALISSIAIATLSSEIVRAKLMEQGLQATETFAGQSILALLYSSADNAKDPAQTILGFPSVQGVAIYDTSRKLLFAQGAEVVVTPATLQWPNAAQMDQETNHAWHFVAPVYSRSSADEEASPFHTSSKSIELIGFVRLAMGKDTLLDMEASILRTNLSVAVGFAGCFLFILLIVTKRLTIPLQHLATTMGYAAAGEKNVRANIGGPKDIINMEIAFNSMMEVLDTRQRELLNARDQALELARIKGEFAANVSHELRTPLNAVLGMLELLQEMGLTAKQLEYVVVAHTAGEALLRLIEDVLDFSRIGSGMSKVQPIDFVLHELLDEVIGLLAGQARRKDLDVSYTISPEILMALRGDAARIRQVLVNLVGNAVKFTEHGSVDIRVTPAPSEKYPLQLRFEVVDTGIGIPLEAQNRIFDAFVQADGSTTRTYGGTGLGLAICRQLVEFMGGQIGVTSIPGKGAHFWFTMPFTQPKRIPISSKSSQSNMAKLRFLIIADNERIRHFLGQILHGWAITHIGMESTEQALKELRDAAAKREPYHFAIIDQRVADSGSIDLVRTMAADPVAALVKVILLNNLAHSDRTTSELTNVVGYVGKPVQASLLYDCIVSAEIGEKPSAAYTPKPEKEVKEEKEQEPAAYLGRNILVVEDNRANQQVALAMLARIGCHVVLASTGREALALVARRPFDLLLMDCHMPEMDGYEATTQIRALNNPAAHLPIIAMTANVQKGDCERCLTAGMDDYLGKPLKLSALREKLQYWLTHKRTGQATTTPVSPVSDAPLPQHPPQPAQLLDIQTLNELKDDIGDAFPQMIDVFLEDTPAQLHAIEQAIITGDAATIADFAHCIKGAGKNLGANRLVEITRQLEEEGHNGRMQRMGELFATALIEYELLKTALQQEVHTNQEHLSDQERSKPCILVADDDRTIRFALCDVLQKDGYRVEQVSSGLQALSLCEQDMPDLLLLDAKMPEMDGFAVCTRLRAMPKGLSTPILIITALEDDHSIELAFAAGATDYIPKPVHFAVLRQRVARLLDASHTEEHIHRLAYQDMLTGLPNRALFMERVEATLKQTLPEEQMHAVLVLDLDRFKLTNDTLGHNAGDLLLKTVAMRIQGCSRMGDLVSRFGGDEFTLLLENISDPSVAAAVATKICAAIAKPFAIAGQEFYISASIGISIFPADGNDVGLLIQRADTAMFRAKERGNTYRFYEESMEQAVSIKLKLESDLRRALEREEFFLHYQPQYSQRTGLIIGLEALIRWQHPELGLISPAQFIPAAEEAGLIDAIGDWVLRQACRQNKAWQQSGLPAIPVAVNLSARQFEEDIADSILAILAETGLEPCYLELEITESAVMKEPQRTCKTLERLKAAGLLISIDDFGTGYSSLGQLKNFPFDKLKIDQSFIRDVTTNPDDAAIVITIIAIAKSLKLNVIAEGVETQEQLDYLRDNDCDEIQGFYFSKPVDEQAIESLLGSMNR